MKDPTKIPVQLNIQVPWDFKQFLERKASSDKTSQNKLVLKALMNAYGREFAHEQAPAAR